jgi:hypothetical protein
MTNQASLLLIVLAHQIRASNRCEQHNNRKIQDTDLKKKWEEKGDLWILMVQHRRTTIKMPTRNFGYIERTLTKQKMSTYLENEKTEQFPGGRRLDRL